MVAKPPWRISWSRRCPTAVLCTKMTFSRWVLASGKYCNFLTLEHCTSFACISKVVDSEWSEFPLIPLLCSSLWIDFLCVFVAKCLLVSITASIIVFSFCVRWLFNTSLNDKQTFSRFPPKLSACTPILSCSISMWMPFSSWIIFVFCVSSCLAVILLHVSGICKCSELWGCSNILLVTVISETWSDRSRGGRL